MKARHFFNKILPSAFLALALLASCGKKIEPGQTAAKRPVVGGVQTAVVEEKTVPQEYETSGSIKSKNLAMVASKLMGAVTSVRVDRGQMVRKGELLMTIEAADARQKEEQARQGLDEARKAVSMASEQKALADTTYGRYRKLYEEKAVAGQEFDEISTRRQVAALQLEQAQSALGRAKAGLKEAEAYVGYSVVRSPINGVVIEKKVDVGSMAAPGMPLVSIEEPVYQVEVSLDERFYGKIKRGSRISIEVPSTGAKETLKVSEVTPQIDPATRSFAVKASVPSAGGLQGGLYVKVYVPDGQRQAILVPDGAVRHRGQLDFVYVAGKDGVVELRAIRTGREYDGYVEALAGLAPGERVVASGFDRVSEGVVLKEAGK
ncbi:MAG: efflux RND transporter periplasmic adaptor subunit [Nitrospiraceae bacterium]|nr:efflux RND transporter periplasmic adaptor subunit [Nitrospiraceae bacterium]